MENVPQVVGTKNIKDFQKWEQKLASLGYANHISILNGKNFGIPQNRERCFMVSILNQGSYEFPMTVPLKYELKDFLEENPDDKYFLSEKMIEFFLYNTKKMEEEGNGFKFKPTDGGGNCKNHHN